MDLSSDDKRNETPDKADVIDERVDADGSLGEDHNHKTGVLPEEDDDNPYQHSDEALPDDQEEKAIAADPSREGTRFDEIIDRDGS